MDYRKKQIKETKKEKTIELEDKVYYFPRKLKSHFTSILIFKYF